MSDKFTHKLYNSPQACIDGSLENFEKKYKGALFNYFQQIKINLKEHGDNAQSIVTTLFKEFYRMGLLDYKSSIGKTEVVIEKSNESSG